MVMCSGVCAAQRAALRDEDATGAGPAPPVKSQTADAGIEVGNLAGDYAHRRGRYGVRIFRLDRSCAGRCPLPMGTRLSGP
jgi:hypothetical protein